MTRNLEFMPTEDQLDRLKQEAEYVERELFHPTLEELKAFQAEWEARENRR